MSKAYIEDFGKVEFDPMCYDNNVFDLYVIAICDENEQVISEEHYTSEDDFNSALHHKYGRDVRNVIRNFSEGDITVNDGGDLYTCHAVYHIAYVVDED